MSNVSLIFMLPGFRTLLTQTASTIPGYFKVEERSEIYNPSAESIK